MEVEVGAAGVGARAGTGASTGAGAGAVVKEGVAVRLHLPISKKRLFFSKFALHGINNNY